MAPGAEGDGVAWSCWLTGSGAYDGYTYYKQTIKEVSDKFLDDHRGRLPGRASQGQPLTTTG